MKSCDDASTSRDAGSVGGSAAPEWRRGFGRLPWRRRRAPAKAPVADSEAGPGESRGGAGEASDSGSDSEAARALRKGRPKHSRRPPDDDARQQRLRAWVPVMTPAWYIVIMGSLSAFCLLVGGALYLSDAVVAKRVEYDGPGSASPCHVEVADAAARCVVNVTVDERMAGPIEVYYEIGRFYQNHRTYITSMSWEQLHDGTLKPEKFRSDCFPLVTNASKTLHPCGVVANTLFNDVITLRNGDLDLEEGGAAWPADTSYLYRQPVGFEWRPAAGPYLDDPCFSENAHLGPGRVFCANATCGAAGLGARPCLGYACRGGHYDAGRCDAGSFAAFSYRDPAKFQYLYETFPQIISPLVGVRAEKFAVWTKLAALPRFRKRYGRIDADLAEGTVLSFDVENNFDVHAFGGDKAIVIASLGTSGFEILPLAYMYLLVGATCGAVALAALARQYYAPLYAGDPTRCLQPLHADLALKAD